MTFEEPLKDYVRAVQSIKVGLVLFSAIGTLACLLQPLPQVWAKMDCFTLYLIKCSCYLMKQATIAERANAFRRQCELAETMKLKEINLYTPGSQFLLFD